MHSFPPPRTTPALNPRILVASVLAFFACPAHAYIDPGSGSFLLQILLAAVVGAMFYARQGADAVKRFVRRLFGKKE